MGGVYFCIPVVCGYYIMEWAKSYAPTEIQTDTRTFSKKEDEKAKNIDTPLPSISNPSRENFESENVVKRQTNIFSEFLKHTIQKETKR